MANFNSVNEILDFAIAGEREAQNFYADLARKADRSGMRELFASFVAEERQHEQKLREIKAGKLKLGAGEKVTDLKIGDYLVAVKPSPRMTYQQALILAMKKEKAAFKMYTDLASRVKGNLKKTFLDLAQEEAKHKLHFEIEYDDNITTEN